MGLFALFMLVFTVAVTACEGDDALPEAQGEESEPSPVQAPTEDLGVVYLFARSPTSIIPTMAVTPDDIAVVDQVFETLTRPDAELGLRPGAAVSWEVSEDARVHTFRLRDGATFHDGSPVTASSFIQAWERVADRTVEDPSPAHHLLEHVDGIEEARDGGELGGAVAVDEWTLEVTLRVPYAEFPAVASHPALAPLPPSSQWVADFDRMPIGNGPLRMAEPWHPGQVIRLEPAPDHPRAPVGIRQVVFRIYDGDDAEEAAFEDLQRGLLDLAPVPIDELGAARSRFGSAIDGRVGPGVIDGLRLASVFLAFDVTFEPYDDIDLRRAIAALVGPSAMGLATEGDLPPARSVVPPDVVPGYDPPRCARCDLEPADAAALLWDTAEEDAEGEDVGDESAPSDEESGSVRSYDLTLVFLDSPRYEHIAGSLRRQIDALEGEGELRLEVVPLDQSAWLEGLRAGEIGMTVSGWLAEYPTAGAFLDHLFHPDRIGTDNLTRFDDEDVTALLDEARETIDPERRMALHAEVESIILDRMPVVPIHLFRHAYVATDRMTGVVVDASGRIELSGLRPGALDRRD